MLRSEQGSGLFTIRAGDEGAPTERAAELSDDAAALAHACRIVGELMQSLTSQQFAGGGLGRDAPEGVFDSILSGVLLKVSQQ
jgi:hypothetical protein